MSDSSFQLFQKQQKYLEKMQKERPDLFEVDKLFREEEVLPQIGITTLDPNRPEGFLRLYPQDFIVEEIQKDGGLSQIEPKDNVPEKPEEEKFTLYADLVKIGISTLEAVSRLAKALEITPNKIGYAGIKDAQALSSQRIALPKIGYEKVKDLKLEGFFLNNFFYGRGTVEIGSLLGNRFTIFVRTEKRFAREELKNKLAALKENGFLNYYQTQRFGGARMLSHILGKLILQKKYEETIKAFLTTPSDYSIKLIKAVRARAAENYGDWKRMREILNHLPYNFQNEIKILEYLEKYPRNFIGALIALQDQTQLWVYAYASLLFNEYLSWATHNNATIPRDIPLLLSPDYQDQNFYRALLDRDGIRDLQEALRPFKFIPIKRRFNPAVIFLKNILAKSLPDGVIISFSLDKGAYATTFLMNLFKLRQGLPIPLWLNRDEIDSKKILEIGTCAPACERLKEYIFSVLDYKKE
ncbi:MAG: tRNA pseudouridine13 synthase [Parcubacteria group bacterium LiPW_72]|nr:MAG: tRNA pseudouridine13 synthase [Parcubacteria group bacterium LiPW_72]